MTPTRDIINEAAQRLAKAVGRKVFRGGALENRGNAPMGKGHDNDRKPFDIETACYLKPVFDAYDNAVRNGERTEIVLLAGVKTMKSFALEICCADHVCNRNGDAGLFFGSGDVADTVSTTRIMSDYRGIKRFADKIRTIPEGATARFQVTNGAVKFPDKTFFLLPANLNELQQKNLGFAGMQDAFVTEATGVIEEMIARTTQYRDAIVFLESQGGETNFDHDRHYRNTNQGELHVLCPSCGKPHIFNWKAWDEESMRRPDDFIPTPPLAIPSLDSESWIAHHRPLILEESRRVAGFQRGDDKLIKRANGDYNQSAVLEQTHFRCYHCDGIWLDDGEFGKTRIHLDRTSHYVSANPDALPNKIGFNFPQWINRRLTRERKSGWGHMMMDKLNGQRNANENGNFEPLKIWWQKVGARTWDSAAILTRAPERPGAMIYDVSEKILGEKCRISATDIQFKLTHMVYLAVAVGDGVPPRVLHYEWVKPPTGMTDHQAAEHCKSRVRALDKEFGIYQINSVKDGAHEPGLVREWAAEDAVWGKVHDGSRWKQCWCAYPLLIGDDRPSYKWTHPGRKDTWERFKQHQWHKVPVMKNGKRTVVDVSHRLWSNPSIKEIAERWIKGEGAPKLQIHEKFLRDQSDEGLWRQLTSEEKRPWKNTSKLVYQKIRPHNHAWDCFAMIIERCDELGYLTTFATPQEDVEE